MDLYHSLAGMLRVELTSADLPGAMDALNGHGIPLFSVQQTDEVTMEFSIRRRDFRQVNALGAKRGERIRILSRRGLFWLLRSIKDRPVLAVGLAVFLCLMLYLPSRVFFVRVEGAKNVPVNRILESAEGCGIRFGASRREVRSERVKNALLEVVPQLQWAGVNTSGCVAVISVRERSDTAQTEAEGFVTGITAAKDGIITSCTATAGNLLCAPGQAVKEGQLLISSYTDCGLTIRADRAEGEVYATTMEQILAVTPDFAMQRGAVESESRNLSIIIGKKRINLWKDSGIWDTTCGRIYEEYYVTLPGGFQLPLGLAVETVRKYPLEEVQISQTDAQALLGSFAPRYLTGRMIAGKILSRNEIVTRKDGCYTLAGEYVCTEMIGRVQREQIGEYHGEDR